MQQLKYLLFYIVHVLIGSISAFSALFSVRIKFDHQVDLSLSVFTYFCVGLIILVTIIKHDYFFYSPNVIITNSNFLFYALIHAVIFIIILILARIGSTFIIKTVDMNMDKNNTKDKKLSIKKNKKNKYLISGILCLIIALIISIIFPTILIKNDNKPILENENKQQLPDEHVIEEEKYPELGQNQDQIKNLSNEFAKKILPVIYKKLQEPINLLLQDVQKQATPNLGGLGFGSVTVKIKFVDQVFRLTLKIGIKTLTVRWLHVATNEMAEQKFDRHVSIFNYKDFYADVQWKATQVLIWGLLPKIWKDMITAPMMLYFINLLQQHNMDIQRIQQIFQDSGVTIEWFLKLLEEQNLSMSEIKTKLGYIEDENENVNE